MKHEDIDHSGLTGAGIPETIVNAKGDIIAATAADTVARLAVGTNGQMLTAASGETTGLQWTTPGSGTSLNPGTSFPGSPSSNDLCYRTDRDLLYFYDGTRWLTVTLYTMKIAEVIASISGAATVGNAAVWSNDYDVWMENLHWSSFVQTTNNGTNFWTVNLRKRNAGAAAVIVGPTTAADAADVWVTHKTAIGALLGVTEDVLTMDAQVTLSPGSLNLATMLTYRLVG